MASKKKAVAAKSAPAPQPLPQPQHPTPGPWLWVNWGGTYSLVSMAISSRPVVLTQLTTREAGGHSPPDRVLAVGVYDEEARGRILVPLTPEHPDAKLIAAAPALLAACREALEMLEQADVLRMMSVLQEAIKEATA